MNLEQGHARKTHPLILFSEVTHETSEDIVLKFGGSIFEVI